jgi:hypothetical protein
LFNFAVPVCFVLCAVVSVAWIANEIGAQPWVKCVGRGDRSAQFLAINKGAISLESQWVIPVDETDPSLGPRGFSGAAAYGHGEPDLSHYHQLKNGQAKTVLQWWAPRQWIPGYSTAAPSGWLLEGEYVRRIDAKGVGHLVQSGYRFFHTSLLIPFWLILALLAPLPTIWLVSRLRRRRRLADNLCPVCGYDLRATPGRCPECGTPVARE